MKSSLSIQIMIILEIFRLIRVHSICPCKVQCDGDFPWWRILKLLMQCRIPFWASSSASILLLWMRQRPIWPDWNGLSTTSRWICLLSNSSSSWAHYSSSMKYEFHVFSWMKLIKLWRRMRSWTHSIAWNYFPAFFEGILLEKTSVVNYNLNKSKFREKKPI